MTLAPEVPTPFSALYHSLRRPAIPCRISFLLDGGGARNLLFKHALASMLSLFSDTNKRILAGYDYIRHRRQQGESFLRSAVRPPPGRAPISWTRCTSRRRSSRAACKAGASRR